MYIAMYCSNVGNFLKYQIQSTLSFIVTTMCNYAAEYRIQQSDR